ncbi:MAG: NADPH:quinone oxidoreductase family protein [Solirubrobacteraceae bacterium]
MRALRVITEDGPEAVELRDDVASPVGPLVIAVRAAGVSFPDLLMTRGQYQLRQPLPFTLGWEAAGEVLSASEDSSWQVGDRVVTLSFGAHAERVAADESLTFALPHRLGFEEGAALLLNYLTALAALERRGRLQAGETVLVHGAAGGVGTASIQIAKALGAHVVAAVSTQVKADAALAAGADEVVVGEDFRSQLSGPVNVVIDPVGGQERFTDSLRALAPEGRAVVVGFTAGQIPTVKVNRLLNRNIDVVGCAFGVLATTPDGMTAAAARLGELVQSGAVRPVVGSQFKLEDGRQALRQLADRRAIGKVVLTLQ